jgi:8-oxo-dGTP diphosphatase
VLDRILLIELHADDECQRVFVENGVGRRFVRDVEAHDRILLHVISAQPADVGEHGAVRVVAAAIVRDDRVLAARRSRPAGLAGGWEFPGGKVEPGESDVEALQREVAEELGVGIAVGAHLGTVSDGRVQLLLYAASLVSGEPAAGADHDEVRWLDGEGLSEPAWLPIDRELLPAVTAFLDRPVTSA